MRVSPAIRRGGIVLILTMMAGIVRAQPSPPAGEGARYLVELSGVGLPQFHESDAVRTLAALRGPGDVLPPPASIDTSRIPSGGGGAPALPPEEAAASSVENADPRPMGTDTTGEGMIESGAPAPTTPAAGPSPAPAPSDPTQAFRDRLASIYSITDDADVRAIWDRFQSEPNQVGADTITDREKTSNAVIKFSIAQAQGTPPRTIGDADFARMQGLTGQGGPATLRVSSSMGMSLRNQPWGQAGQDLSLGTALDVELPPDGSGWVRVTSAGQEGYVNALWLEP